MGLTEAVKLHNDWLVKQISYVRKMNYSVYTVFGICGPKAP